MENYIDATVRLCWKMVIQRPPMTFNFTEKRQPDNVQELHWGSVDSKKSKVCVVFPVLLHHGNIMGKGRIYLYKPTGGHV